MIFEQSGIGTDASFMQAVLVGIINPVFTVVAILLIDKLGRRPLMLTGLVVIAASVSFVVQLVFPWELENFGPATTFLIYGSFAIAGLLMVMKILPETKGRSLEELENELVHRS